MRYFDLNGQKYEFETGKMKRSRAWSIHFGELRWAVLGCMRTGKPGLYNGYSGCGFVAPALQLTMLAQRRGCAVVPLVPTGRRQQRPCADSLTRMLPPLTPGQKGAKQTGRGPS